SMIASAAEQEPEFRVVQSEAFHRIDQLGEVLRGQLFKLFDYGYYLPDERYLTFDRLPKPLPAEKFQLSRFTEEMKRGQFEAAFDLLRNHVASLSSAYTLDVFEYKSFLSNMIFT